MEIIDKETIIDCIYLNGSKENGIYSLTLPQLEQVAKELESIYIKQIEEKDKDIGRIQARRTEITEEATRLKQKLQEAKELLKRVIIDLHPENFSEYNTKEEIQEFLNKNT